MKKSKKQEEEKSQIPFENLLNWEFPKYEHICGKCNRGFEAGGFERCERCWMKGDGRPLYKQSYLLYHLERGKKVYKHICNKCFKIFSSNQILICPKCKKKEYLKNPRFKL